MLSLAMEQSAADLTTCSRICRAATTFDRLQVERCNGDWPNRGTAEWEAELTRREEQLERLIRRHVAALGWLPHAAAAVTFRGDPRGYTVRISYSDDRGSRYMIGIGPAGIGHAAGGEA